MQMDEGLDTGPILLQQHYKLDQDETSQSLHEKLASVGAEVLLRALDLLEQGNLHPKPQDNQLATYAEKICKEEALIDWQRSALELEQEIRAFNPWPVAFTSWQGQSLRIWMAKALTEGQPASPRTILKVDRDGLDIATGQGVLRVLQVQLPGGKPMRMSDFYNAHQQKLVVGEHLI
jgi:methionyl-tRNA formyltransferase